MAVVKAAITEADKEVAVAQDGAITIPAAACSGGELMKSFLGGQQMLCGGKDIQCEVTVPVAGKYKLSARVVTVHGEGELALMLNDSKETVSITIPYTVGLWQKTKPVEVSLVSGKNTLQFAKPSTSFVLKDFTLMPVR
jgi:hypothetical protein